MTPLPQPKDSGVRYVIVNELGGYYWNGSFESLESAMKYRDEGDRIFEVTLTFGKEIKA